MISLLCRWEIHSFGGLRHWTELGGLIADQRRPEGNQTGNSSKSPPSLTAQDPAFPISSLPPIYFVFNRQRRTDPGVRYSSSSSGFSHPVRAVA
jgi:hypothetical protein